MIAALGCAVLFGCAPPVADVEMPVPVFRDTSAQIASQTDVTADRMAGTWYVRQRFGAGGGIGVMFDLSVLPGGDLQLTLPRGNCAAIPCDDMQAVLVLLKASGPGRWRPIDPPNGVFDRDLWVMWMDFDSRTAAFGTPSGEFGWIVDKNRRGGGDRIVAARDIMEWFGYAVSQLNEVSP